MAFAKFNKTTLLMNGVFNWRKIARQRLIFDHSFSDSSISTRGFMSGRKLDPKTSLPLDWITMKTIMSPIVTIPYSYTMAARLCSKKTDSGKKPCKEPPPVCPPKLEDCKKNKPKCEKPKSTKK